MMGCGIKDEVELAMEWCCGSLKFQFSMMCCVVSI